MHMNIHTYTTYTDLSNQTALTKALFCPMNKIACLSLYLNQQYEPSELTHLVNGCNKQVGQRDSFQLS